MHMLDRAIVDLVAPLPHPERSVPVGVTAVTHQTVLQLATRAVEKDVSPVTSRRLGHHPIAVGVLAVDVVVTAGGKHDRFALRAYRHQ